MKGTGLSLEELKKKENEELGFGEGVQLDPEMSFSKDLNESRVNQNTPIKEVEKSERRDYHKDDPKA